MKRVITPKIDKRFFCPHCKRDLREYGINFVEYRNQRGTTLYDSDGEYRNTDYGDSDVNGYNNYVECGNCGEELSNISVDDIFERLDLSEEWENA